MAAEGNHELTPRPTCQSLAGPGGLRLNWAPLAFIISVTPLLAFISISSAWLRPSGPVQIRVIMRSAYAPGRRRHPRSGVGSPQQNTMIRQGRRLAGTW